MTIGLCEEKDCDILICSTLPPLQNPPKKFTDRTTMARAIDAVVEGAEKIYGHANAVIVRRMLERLPVVYNGRLSRALGRCVMQRTVQPGKQPPVTVPIRIEIASKMNIPPDYLHTLMVHEYAHAVRALIAVNYDHENGHGRPWQMLMVAAGEKPNAKCDDPRIYQGRRQMEEKRRAKRQGRRPRELAEVLTIDDVQVGDLIAFWVRRRGKPEQRVQGRVEAKDARTAWIRSTTNGKWQVSYEVLERDDGKPPKLRLGELPPKPNPDDTAWDSLLAAIEAMARENADMAWDQRGAYEDEDEAYWAYRQNVLDTAREMGADAQNASGAGWVFDAEARRLGFDVD